MKVIYNDLCIRNAEEKDSVQLTQWWNDGKVMAHAGFPYGIGITPEKVKEKIIKESDETRRTLIIEHQNIPIGEMSYRNVGNSTCEIGIKICNFDFQNKGLGRILLSLFIDELFNMGFKKIILDTNLKNTRAQHIYELLGFKKVRVNENSWTDQLGELQTSVDYELIESDFVDWTKK